MSSIFTYQKPKMSSIKSEVPSSIFQYKKPLIEEEKPENVKFPFEEEGDLEREIERNIARGTSRIGERIVGLPGDIVSLIQNLTGKKTEEFPLPTSTQLQEKSEKLSRGYTKPQTQFEEKTDEFIGDVASFMMPGGGGYSISRNLGIPLATNLAKEGVRYQGKDEKVQSGTKIGSMVVLDLLFNRGKGSSKLISDKFNAAKSAIPKGAVTDARILEHSLSQLEKTLQLGGTATSKTKTLQKIGEMKSVIKNGKIDPNELIEFRQTINEAISELGGFKIEVPPSVRKKAIYNLNKLKNEVVKSGERYGAAENPEFLENWRSANEASSAFQKSNYISNFIKRNFGNKFQSTGAKLLFGLGGTGAAGAGAFFSPGAIATLGGLSAITTSAYQGYKIFSRVKNSPTLRKYYTNILKASAEGNTPQMTQNMKALDKKLAEEEKKEKDLIQKFTKD